MSKCHRMDSRVLPVVRVILLGLSAMYLLVGLAALSFRMMLGENLYFHADWGTTHGEPFLMVFLGLFLLYEAYGALKKI